jgi:tetratricopeptide (TPR) repeat protein
VEQIPAISQPKLVTSGVGFWLVWDGQLSPVVNQIFTEFGGFFQSQDGNQALWFFFGDEAFKALGRLSGFARVNKLPLFIQAFPATMMVGNKYSLAFTCAEQYLNQDADPPQDMEILVHTDLKAMVESLPGLSLKPADSVPGLADAQFGHLAVDAILGQDSPLSWYTMLRPLGDPLDKNASDGWRSIFSELQSLLERLAVKYLSYEGYLIFGVDNVRAFRNITRELLKLGISLKATDAGNKYWPCVMASVQKGGFHFNKDLPKRINLDWRQLSPDYPHMSYKSALYLGEGFRINDVRNASGSVGIDDWCNVSLSPEEENGESGGELPFSMPTQLLAGSYPPCFYCGLSNHQPKECPSKALPDMDEEVWEQLGLTDMAKLNEAGASLNRELSKADAGELANMLEARDERGLIVRGVFESTFANQLRCLRRIWRSKGKDLPGGFADLVPPDEGTYLWGALDLLKKGDQEGFEIEIAQVLAKHGRGFQPRSLQGFMAMEQLDWNRAVYFWQEASRGAFTPLQRGWLAYLEGRAMEVQENYQKAMASYSQAKSECPRWNVPSYRQGVCMVKLGFTDQGLRGFLDQIYSDPNVFNRIILDPELERGRIRILSALWKPWSEALAARNEKAALLGGLPEHLKSWFRADHPFLKESLERANMVSELAKIDNYVSYTRVVKAFDALQTDLHQTVEKEIAAINSQLKDIHEELKIIHHEAAWFPFSKLLREFNKDFNACATKLNWMRTTSLQVAANFRKGQDYVAEIETSINLLKTRLVTLRIVRDATLFVLLLGKSFMWLELVGLALSLIAVPCVIYLAQRTGQTWLAGILAGQKWQVQKGLVVIVSILAMAVASLKTAVSFESRRAELFKEEEDKAGKALKKGKKPAARGGSPKALPPGKGPVAAKPGGGKPAAGNAPPAKPGKKGK